MTTERPGGPSGFGSLDYLLLSASALGIATGVVLWLISSPQEKPRIEVSPWIPTERSALGVSVHGAL